MLLLENTILDLIDALQDAREYIDNPKARTEIDSAIGSAHSSLNYWKEFKANQE